MRMLARIKNAAWSLREGHPRLDNSDRMRRRNRAREKDRIRHEGRREAGQLPALEHNGHADDCGCGCQLTEAQWRAEAENEENL